MQMMCDVSAERLKHLKGLYPEIEGVLDFDQMLLSDLNAIVIATSVRTHHKMAKAALLAGKHTFIEKPKR